MWNFITENFRKLFLIKEKEILVYKTKAKNTKKKKKKEIL